MSVIQSNQFRGNPPYHPIAYHAAQATESLRIADMLGSFLAELKIWWQARQQRRIDREAFEHLLDLDDAILDDIGVTRDDVIRANRLPLSVNASAELEIIARQNRSLL
jgi:uncharacterized protein YjiS (DUF1127 family)